MTSPDTSSDDNRALTDAPLAAFLHYLIPSLVGLIAMSSASIVDGIFIGNYVGADALAAVNLILPLLSILFGVGLMLSMGGSVRAGKYAGENDYQSASNIFSKTLMAVVGFGALIIALGLLLGDLLFASLGANEALLPLMGDYFYVLLPFILAQLVTVVLYFFIRIDGYPTLVATALVVGSVVNIVLDYLFIAVFDWQLSGAAWATGISQMLPALILGSYLFFKKRKLHFSFKQHNWGEVFHAAFNGVSEFINETSAAIIALILNWLLMLSLGVDGVAAISVINYLLMVGLMMFFAIADVTQILISQNFGAKLPQRIQTFFNIANGFALFISVLCITLLLGFTEPLIMMFLDEGSTEAASLAAEFVYILWPIFLVNGFNVVISAYLTALHLPKQSGIIALSRSLILPAAFLLGLYWLLDSMAFLWALPLAELITFVLAIVIFLRYKPMGLFH